MYTCFHFFWVEKLQRHPIPNLGAPISKVGAVNPNFQNSWHRKLAPKFGVGVSFFLIGWHRSLEYVQRSFEKYYPIFTNYENINANFSLLWPLKVIRPSPFWTQRPVRASEKFNGLQKPAFKKNILCATKQPFKLQTDRQTDRQTYRQTEKHTDREKYWPTGHIDRH